MDLRQLRYFVVLADELHFRRAAERLNITQAPLSVAIQGLEREFGAQLFHRTQRRVALTEIGQAFREHALDILARVEHGRSDLQDMVAGRAGRLRIGFTAASALLSFFPEIICAFRNKHPKVQLVLQDLSSKEQLLALQSRAIDVGFIRGPGGQRPSDINFTRLLRDPLVVAMHTDNILSGIASLRIDDLKDVPLIFYPKISGVGIYQQFMVSCARRDFTPNIVQEALDSATLVGLAAAGLGVAVVPSELQCIRVPNVLFRPLVDDDAVTELLLASRAGEGSALLSGFRHMVQAALVGWRKDNR